MKRWTFDPESGQIRDKHGWSLATVPHAIAGDENLLRGELKRLEDMGVSHFNAAISAVEDGAWDRTLEFLSSMK